MERITGACRDEEIVTETEEETEEEKGKDDG